MSNEQGVNMHMSRQDSQVLIAFAESVREAELRGDDPVSNSGLVTMRLSKTPFFTERAARSTQATFGRLHGGGLIDLDSERRWTLTDAGRDDVRERVGLNARMQRVREDYE